MSRQIGILVAEVAFLLLLFAGVWMIAFEIPQFKIAAERRIVAGMAVALSGLLLIIAMRWGQFGQ